MFRCLFLRDFNCSESINVNISQNSEIPGSGDSPWASRSRPARGALLASFLSFLQVCEETIREGRVQKSSSRNEDAQRNFSCHGTVNADLWLPIFIFVQWRLKWNLSLAHFARVGSLQKLVVVFIRVQHHCHTGNRTNSNKEVWDHLPRPDCWPRF